MDIIENGFIYAQVNPYTGCVNSPKLHVFGLWEETGVQLTQGEHANFTQKDLLT